MKTFPGTFGTASLRATFTPAVSLVALLGGSLAGQAQTLFSDNFDATDGSTWKVNASNPAAGGDSATFLFDYSTVGIPAAPNSGGTTIGLKLQANATAGVFSGISVSPLGQNFTGDYQLRFDLWQNFNGPAPTGGSGSTQLSGAGIGTAGTTPQWAGATYDSLFFLTTGDGNSAQDYRVYPVGNNAPVTTGYYAAGTGTAPDARNQSHPYYASFGGVSAPLAQATLFPQQSGTTLIGSQAFEWHDVAITKTGDLVTWDIDGVRIATVNAAGLKLGGGNLLLAHSDINAGSSTDPNAGALSFGLVDNVRVVTVPEPSTWALLGAGTLLLLGGARRRLR
jgi:hypothetical protein